MAKCDFNKIAKKFYWNHTCTWVFSCKSAVYFQNTFFKNTSKGLLLCCCSFKRTVWQMAKHHSPLLKNLEKLHSFTQRMFLDAFILRNISRTCTYIEIFFKKLCSILCNDFIEFLWRVVQNMVKLKETRNSFKKWPFNLWWISNKTFMEVGNITRAATFKSFFHLNYKNTQLLFLWQYFLIFSWEKHKTMIFGGYTKIWIARFL